MRLWKRALASQYRTSKQIAESVPPVKPMDAQPVQLRGPGDPEYKALGFRVLGDKHAYVLYLDEAEAKSLYQLLHRVYG